MRIVAGRHRGRVLAAPAGRAVRPTSSRAREALFNILAQGEPPLDGAVVADIFAGSGALGFEALSRGAAFVSFIEQDRAALEAIRANARMLGAAEQMAVLAADARRPPPARAPASIVFLDPPYHGGLIPDVLLALRGKGWFAPGARLVIEVAADEAFVPPAGIDIEDERIYGAARLILARPV